ncbi:hypothetical protein [Gordonia hongkongensis]|nr:hypothetical protein [Gordonia hongkongensis]
MSIDAMSPDPAGTSLRGTGRGRPQAGSSAPERYDGIGSSPSEV